MEEQERRDIHIVHHPQWNQLVIGLTDEGIKYMQSILEQLASADNEHHCHVDHFDGTLGGDFKHLVIERFGNW